VRERETIGAREKTSIPQVRGEGTRRKKTFQKGKTLGFRAKLPKKKKPDPKLQNKAKSRAAERASRGRTKKNGGGPRTRSQAVRVGTGG